MAAHDESFSSSDSRRSARPLLHARTLTLSGPIQLELGGELPQIEVVYETYGRLNPDRSNAVLICHALSGDSHVAAHDVDDDPGWWDLVVGRGKAIDPDRFFVICPNLLGGCRGTTGPGSINPATGRPYGRDFPTVTIGDMVEVQRRLIDHLEIEQLLAVVGGSMGGHQALTWAVRHPDRIRSAVPVATSPRLTSQALAFDVVGRNAIMRDPHFHHGQYYDQPTKPNVGLALARMIGHITYLSRAAMTEKFEADRLDPRDVAIEYEKTFSVGSYLGYQGQKFVERFDPNSYITLSMAMDLFDLGDSRAALQERFGRSTCHWLVVSFSSDWLFPPDQSRDLVYALLANSASVSYANIQSDCGHDAFLLADEVDQYGTLMGAFLDNVLADRDCPAAACADDEPPGHGPKSIFHRQRIDYDHILELVPAGATVLDLGCGRGGLLERLQQRDHPRLLGLELDEAAVIACVQRGLNVVHDDLIRGLQTFGDRQFDCVVLSLTLQAVTEVETLMEHMLRVGELGIVSFPNFGYHKIRAMVAEQGRSPKTPGILHHEWWNTPNRRFFSILDFEEFCRDRGIKVLARAFLDTETASEIVDDPNRNADLAIFSLGR